MHIFILLNYLICHRDVQYRSLGDSVVHTAGVISEPKYTERDLDPATDKFVVVATDAFWGCILKKDGGGDYFSISTC